MEEWIHRTEGYDNWFNTLVAVGKLEPLELLVRIYHLNVKGGDWPSHFFPVFASGGGEFPYEDEYEQEEE